MRNSDIILLILYSEQKAGADPGPDKGRGTTGQVVGGWGESAADSLVS